MILLPIVDRELRVAARRTATYRTRVWAAAGAMLLAAWKCLGFAWQGKASTASQGHSLFYTLATLAFVYCLCIGARVTSDCVSEEKREGTLGLLFLTDLKGWHVVSGKLVASSLNALYGLLAVLPLLALPLLLGGVTLVQFGHIVVVLLNALVFSLSAGIFVSALSRNERRSMFATLVIVLGLCAAPFCALFYIIVVLEWVQNPADLEPLIPWLVANPLYPFLISLPLPWIPMLPLPSWTFWASGASVQAFSAGLLLITAILLPTVWKDRPPAPKRKAGPSLVERFRLWARGDSEQRQQLRSRLLARNPFLWLVSRDRFKPAYAWLFFVSMVAMWFWGYVKYQEVMFDFYPLAPTLLLVHCFLKIWIVSEVSHRFVEDQRNGALELLLSTPLTMNDIFRGQELALLRQFGRPVLALCTVELLTFQSAYPLSEILPVLILLVADLITLMWLAMRLSLTARSINEVLVKSVLWVLVLPWLFYGLLWPLWQWAWPRLNSGEPEFGFPQRLRLWFVIGMVVDCVLVLRWARPQLLTQWRGPFNNLVGMASQGLRKSLAWRLKIGA